MKTFRTKGWVVYNENKDNIVSLEIDGVTAIVFPDETSAHIMKRHYETQIADDHTLTVVPVNVQSLDWVGD